MTLSRSPRILITRLSHIGDCLLGLPMLSAVRAKFPRAFIAWVVERPSHQLLEGHPDLDQVIVLRSGWLKSPRQVLKVRSELRALRFDVSLDPQGLIKSSSLGWLAGARRRIGLARPEGRELSPWLNNELVQVPDLHLVDRCMALSERLGALPAAAGEPGSSTWFRLPSFPDAEVSMASYLAEARLPTFAMLNPGGSWASKRWPVERFAEVAQHLGTAHSLPSVVVWNGDEERAWAEQIVEQANGHARFAPPTNLRELACLAARADLFVGSDTGPMHLAAATGTPCVGLFGPTQPSRSGPYGPQHVAVQKATLHGGSRLRRGADDATMRAIQVADAVEACDQILARPKRQVA